MSDIGGLVDELIAAGTPPGMAAQIVARAFAAGVASAPVRVTSADESVTRRRENDRIRQQTRRDNLRKSADSRDNPQMSHGVSTLKESKKEEEGRKIDAPRTSVRGCRLPDEWLPQEVDGKPAIAKLGQHGYREELSKFRDYWKAQPGQRGLKLDWDATWRNWIRNAKGPQNGRRTVQDAARDLHEQTIAAVLAFDEPAPRSLRDGTGPDVVRLLPPRRCE